MPHGGPDYGVGAPKATVYRLQDMAELAVRLGSIVSFDRRGDVVWLDDFEDNIAKWDVSVIGGGSSAALSTDRPHSGNKSAKLTCATGTSPEVQLVKMFPYPILSGVGFEVAVCGYTSFDYLLADIVLANGTTITTARARYNPVAQTLQYLGADGNYHTIDTGVALVTGYNLYNRIKLVSDLAAGKLNRLLYNERSYDLSAYTAYTGASSAGPYLTVVIKVVGHTGDTDVVYVDDVIVTQNEP